MHALHNSKPLILHPGDSVIHFCVRRGWIELLALLLNLPPEPSLWTEPNAEGLTPSDLARQLGYTELAEILSS